MPDKNPVGMSNFFVFDEAQQNIMSNEAYAAHVQRQAGVIPGMADSKLHNRLYHQVSIMAAALGEVIKRAGLSATDGDLEALVQSIKGTFTEPFAKKAELAELNNEIEEIKKNGVGGSGIVVIPEGEDIAISDRKKNTIYFKVTDSQSLFAANLRVSPNMGIRLDEAPASEGSKSGINFK